jgi:hypothetical protein
VVHSHRWAAASLVRNVWHLILACWFERRGVSALHLLSLLLLLLNNFSQLYQVLLLIDELLQQQISVVLLAHVLDLQLTVLLHEVSVFVIDLLSDLGHRLKMFIQFFLLLFKVVLVLLFLLSLSLQLLLDVL